MTDSSFRFSAEDFREAGVVGSITYTQILFHWSVLKSKLNRTIFSVSENDVQAKA